METISVILLQTMDNEVGKELADRPVQSGRYS